jgi:hypothetical protein
MTASITSIGVTFGLAAYAAIPPACKLSFCSAFPFFGRRGVLRALIRALLSLCYFDEPYQRSLAPILASSSVGYYPVFKTDSLQLYY